MKSTTIPKPQHQCPNIPNESTTASLLSPLMQTYELNDDGTRQKGQKDELHQRKFEKKQKKNPRVKQ
jgi:hypothetical protein